MSTSGTRPAGRGDPRQAGTFGLQLGSVYAHLQAAGHDDLLALAKHVHRAITGITKCPMANQHSMCLTIATHLRGRGVITVPSAPGAAVAEPDAAELPCTPAVAQAWHDLQCPDGPRCRRRRTHTAEMSLESSGALATFLAALATIPAEDPDAQSCAHSYHSGVSYPQAVTVTARTRVGGIPVLAVPSPMTPGLLIVPALEHAGDDGHVVYIGWRIWHAGTAQPLADGVLDLFDSLEDAYDCAYLLGRLNLYWDGADDPRQWPEADQARLRAVLSTAHEGRQR